MEQGIVKLGQFVEIPVSLFDNWKFVTLVALVIVLRPLVVYIKNKYGKDTTNGNQ